MRKNCQSYAKSRMSIDNSILQRYEIESKSASIHSIFFRHAATAHLMPYHTWPTC